MPTSPTRITDPSVSDSFSPSGGANNSNIPPANFAVPELNSDITGLRSTSVNYDPDSEEISYGIERERNTTAAPKPKVIPASIIKQKLLKPALTSHFECYFLPPPKVITWMGNRNLNILDPNNQELLTLSCSEASLPGSRLATLELQDDHHGVTERHAYRRQFDDSATFTFYVDAPTNESLEKQGYKIIWFFEQWKSFIMGEGSDGGSSRRHKDDPGVRLDDYKWYYRAKFPKDYQTEIFITKFERDFDLSSIGKGGSRQYLEYKFLQAYPISINTMPVSYDGSQVLKCSVSFVYSRYIARRKDMKINPNDEPRQERQTNEPQRNRSNSIRSNVEFNRVFNISLQS